ncbi:hypothetical protein [Sorangium sp. So ce1151]|uniref:hypothetical protein n=1 Tax=Sorangium sp. So ce1151 TaxID=3133332 RepID=UPI003F5E5C79
MNESFIMANNRSAIDAEIDRSRSSAGRRRSSSRPRGAARACTPARSTLGLAVGDAARLWGRGQRGEALPREIVALYS